MGQNRRKRRSLAGFLRDAASAAAPRSPLAVIVRVIVEAVLKTSMDVHRSRHLDWPRAGFHKP
jgi:hypothetical protein